MSSRIRSPRQLLSRLAVVAVAVALLAAGWLPSTPANADAPDWEPTALTGSVQRLFPTTAGALYARTDDALFLTDDLGENWRSVTLPPTAPDRPTWEGRRTAVSVTRDATLFADGEHGIYRSVDTGVTWMPLVLPPSVGTWVEMVAVSPADPSLVYLAMLEEPFKTRMSWLRSDDGGDTWTVLKREPLGTGCKYQVSFFWPHPIDADQAYSSTWGCFATNRTAGAMSHSADRGLTWTLVTTYFDPIIGSPVALTGGHGSLPRRFYLATELPSGPAGQRAWRSDTGVGDWQMLYEQPNVSPSALAYHPEAPDHVYLGVVGHKDILAPGAVLESTNAGDSWTPLGQQSIGAVHDLALSPDEQQLYAATSLGVFRIQVTP